MRTRNTAAFHERRTLSVPDQHMLSIARKTMRLSCVGTLIMGGQNHYQAAGVIHALTGVFVNIDADCTCGRLESRSSLESVERAWARKGGE